MHNRTQQIAKSTLLKSALHNRTQQVAKSTLQKSTLHNRTQQIAKDTLQKVTAKKCTANICSTPNYIISPPIISDYVLSIKKHTLTLECVCF